ncbi:hypothetical protein [Cerasicoccus frondis]|uniref:hypothetical protein n=1 Tax=Cerasicoccus frondis TaxID=490090 RepID=UPI002852BE1B|nr:hypothetical protein [Cerasicoccus frondis]
MSLSLIEESVKWDHDAVYCIRHADEPDEPVSKWRKIAQRSGPAMPSKGHTSFFRAPKPPTPPAKTNNSPTASQELERRITACEAHYASIIESIQRMQQDIASMREFAVMKSDLEDVRKQLDDVTDFVERRHYDLSGVRMEVIGAA